MSEQTPGRGLVWIDMEMSGLDPDRDVILEIATVITNNQLEIIGTGPELIIHQPSSLFNQMDQWNQEHHSASGLWQKVQDSKTTLADAEKATLEFIKKHLKEKESPLCGNSVWQDRRFLFRQMPLLEKYLHYRLIDVSTLKELVQRWYPESFKFTDKKNAHRALDDIVESIEELKFYRAMILK